MNKKIYKTKTNNKKNLDKLNKMILKVKRI